MHLLVFGPKCVWYHSVFHLYLVLKMLAIVVSVKYDAYREEERLAVANYFNQIGALDMYFATYVPARKLSSLSSLRAFW